MKLLIVALAIMIASCCSTAAYACLNDVDSDARAASSLTSESSGLPGTVNVITGRFERNPPLYYMMRIRRVETELKRDPTRLGLYDDIAVACDRLQRDDEAIEWIERKREQLLRLSETDPAAHEQWYRYFANVGTFWAHRWIRHGKDPGRLGEMITARDYIARAIQLKPDAHFGREKYQLAAMNWIINPVATYPSGAGAARRLGYAVYLQALAGDGGSGIDRKGMIEGISGLVVLGNAWESVDMFDALAMALDDKPWLSYLARRRCEELRDRARSSLAVDLHGHEPPLWIDQSDSTLRPALQDQMNLVYRRLRQDAEDWNRERTRFMEKRLLAGRHPDTDPAFWAGYHEKPAPSLELPSFLEMQVRDLVTYVLPFCLIPLVIWGLGVAESRRGVRRTGHRLH